MTRPVSFRLGRTNKEFLSITVYRYSYPLCDDYDDGNWVNVLVECAAGGFSGRVTDRLRTVELCGFLEEIEKLLHTAAGVAEYSSMEGLLSIVLEGNGSNTYVAKCVLMDAIGMGNKLDFSLGLDDAELRETTESLRRVCEMFPVRGRR